MSLSKARYARIHNVCPPWIVVGGDHRTIGILRIPSFDRRVACIYDYPEWANVVEYTYIRSRRQIHKLLGCTVRSSWPRSFCRGYVQGIRWALLRLLTRMPHVPAHLSPSYHELPPEISNKNTNLTNKKRTLASTDTRAPPSQTPFCSVVWCYRTRGGGGCHADRNRGRRRVFF